MKFPNLNEEKKLWRRGFKFVVGLDEAGRGPLAGPVVSAAVLLPVNFSSNVLKGINDSKKLSEKQRENLFDVITNHKDVKWGIGIVSEKVIDKINILQASKLSMQKALADLTTKSGKSHCSEFDDRQFLSNGFLLIDGNFKINTACLPGEMFALPADRQKPIIKGDQKVVSISAASVIAKVTRDKIMSGYDKKYPQYGFKKHKGYPTKFHRQRIKEFGFCQIHRKSFNADLSFIG